VTTTVRDSGQVKVSPLTIYNIDDQDGRQCFIIRGAEQISAGVRLSLSNEGVPTTAGLGSYSVPMLVSTTIPAPRACWEMLESGSILSVVALDFSVLENLTAVQ